MIKNSDIADFDVKHDFEDYYMKAITDFIILKEYFPLLCLTMLPTVDAKEIYISGKLIPYEVLEKTTSENDIERYSITIVATYPSDYPNRLIYVEDILEKINWSRIPNKYEHYHNHPWKEGKKVFCTHHPDGEINDIDNIYKSIAVLNSAWKLYIQYIEYQKTGKWSLDDLRHGSEAIRKLKRLGEYHERSDG